MVVRLSRRGGAGWVEGVGRRARKWIWYVGEVMESGNGVEKQL